ncbi:zinc finger protein 665-like [Branchiostoma lanceolatum]|uniref:zinc finger protein 665-like n=1 Tax=Branchiostoma lanceolatum TaxID=7740 RepID=UPI00345146EC
MATAPGGRIYGLSKDVTLAVLPRLHQEELVFELGRRNIMVGESYKKESLVSKLWFLMIKEYQGMVHSVTPSDTPTNTTGASGSSATEQRNMWVTLSNDLQELMETVTSTNGATNIVPVTATSNSPTVANGAYTATSGRSSNHTQSQPLRSVTIASPQRLPMSIFAQEVVLDTTAEEGMPKNRGASPRRSARLHTLETHEEATSSSVGNLGHIGEAVETYESSEENSATNGGPGKGQRKLRAMAVTRSKSCSVGSNTVVTDLGAIRELVDEDGDDTNAAEDEEEDGASSDEDDDAPMDDDDDSDWQPDSPLEDRQQQSSGTKRKASGKDSSSGFATSFEEAVTTLANLDNQPPLKLQRTSHDKRKQKGFQGLKILTCQQCAFTTKYPKVMARHTQGHTHKLKCSKCEFTTESQKDLNQHMTTHDKTRVYACKECEYRGRRKAHLKEHMRVHTGEEALKCHECNFTSKFRGKMARHMAMEHGTQCLLCDQCGYRTTDAYALKLHMNKHTGEKPYKCARCTAAYTNSKGLERHVKSSHPGQNCYKCDHCSHLAESLTLLHEHKKVHKAAHAHKCPVKSCTFSSDDRVEFFDHLSKRHNKSQQYFCNVCNHKTYLLRELKDHMKTHGKVFKCEKCEFSANTYASFRQHITKHNKTAQYKCDKCDFTSKVKSIVVRHSKDHGDNPFQCPHCEFKADTQDDLSIHLGKHMNMYNPITCGLCGYVAKTEEKLEQHIEEHDSELKVHKCDFHGCDFSSPDRQCFIRHVTSHDPSRQFPCELCDYRAKKKCDLATHMRIHTGEKPLKCSKCPYTASLLHELKRHEAGHGRNFPYMCDVCGFTARNKPSLDNHRKLHVGEARMENQIIIHSVIYSHQCLHCDFKASDGHELYLHAMKHINEDKEEDGARGDDNDDNDDANDDDNDDNDNDDVVRNKEENESDDADS